MPVDLRRRPDLRRRRLELVDGQPGARLVPGVLAGALHGDHRPARRTCRPSGARSGSCARSRCRSGGCSPPRRAPGRSSSAAIAALAFAVAGARRCRTSSVATRAGGRAARGRGARSAMSFLAVAMAAAAPTSPTSRAPPSGRRRSTRSCWSAGSTTWCWRGIRRPASPAWSLYLFAGGYWRAGVARAGFCLDAEAVRARRLRAADGATLLLVYALGARALRHAGGVRRAARALTRLAVSAGGAAGAGGSSLAVYLARRPRPRRRAGRGRVGSLVAAGAGRAGAAASACWRRLRVPHRCPARRIAAGRRRSVARPRRSSFAASCSGRCRSAISMPRRSASRRGVRLAPQLSAVVAGDRGAGADRRASLPATRRRRSSRADRGAPPRRAGAVVRRLALARSVAVGRLRFSVARMGLR